MRALLTFPDISPEIFSISILGFEFALRWYAVAYIMALVIGWRLVVALMKSPRLWPGQKAPMTPAQVEELLTWVIFGVILGGRLGFVLFYKPTHYLQNPLEIPMLWNGGMSFHGGLIGVIVALVVFCRNNKIALLSAADALAVATPLGLFFGRIANFINGELWGRTSDVPWAMTFPTDRSGLPRHPSQLYEAALEGLVLAAIILWLAYGRHWLKRPGQIAGTFFAGYGLARMFVELFRQADPQFVTLENPAGWVFHAGGVGLTQGQVLSLPMVVFGLALILIARRRA